MPFAGPLEKATHPLQAQRQENFPESYKAGAAIGEFEFTKQRCPTFIHLYPFKNSRDYRLARHFTESEVPKHRFDAFFKEDILFPASTGDQMSTISFTSGHTFFKRMTEMIEDPCWLSGQVEFPLRLKSEFKYRDILQCIKYLLRQRAFVNYMLWAPVRSFNHEGEPLYSQMNTGSWWWAEQVCNFPTILTPNSHSIVDPARWVHTHTHTSGVGPDPPDKLFRR